MQINLKRNSFLSFADLSSGNDKLNSNESQPNGKNASKSKQSSKASAKKDKFYIEFSKINSTNKSRGVSADEMMCNNKGVKQKANSFKPFVDNLTKVYKRSNKFIFIFIQALI